MPQLDEPADASKRRHSQTCPIIGRQRLPLRDDTSKPARADPWAAGYGRGMADSTRDDLSGSRFERVVMADARFERVDLAGA